jgi:sugar phosphate isomerase/epimerase
MDADPLAAIVALGKAVHYVHAKDTSMSKAAQNLTGRLDTIEHRNVKDRSWSYVTLGYGHGELWWREFCYALRLNGYDGWLSIEHEDIVLSRMEGIRRSVDLLKRTMIEEPSDYALPMT